MRFFDDGRKIRFDFDDEPMFLRRRTQPIVSRCLVGLLSWYLRAAHVYTMCKLLATFNPFTADPVKALHFAILV